MVNNRYIEPQAANKLRDYLKDFSERGIPGGTVFVKDNKEKVQFRWLPWAEIQDIARLLTYGEKKYPGENWKKCTDLNEYMDALDRHLVAYKTGEKADLETGESHLLHAACNILFMLNLEKRI